MVTVLILVGGLFVIMVGMLLWLWKVMKIQQATQEISGKESQELLAQEFAGIEDIRKNVVILPGKRYRSVIAVGAINYHLLSEAERESVEIRYSAFLAGINFPIQILDQTRPLDTEMYVSQLRRRLDESPENLRWHMQSMIQVMQNWTAVTPVLIHQKYIVICYDAPSDLEEEDALIELDRRTASVIQGLESVGLACEVVTTEGILEVLYAFFHKPTMLLQKIRYASEGAWNAWEVRGDEVYTVDSVIQAQKENEKWTGI